MTKGFLPNELLATHFSHVAEEEWCFVAFHLEGAKAGNEARSISVPGPSHAGT